MIVLLQALANPLVPTVFEVAGRTMAAVFVVALIIATVIWIRVFLGRDRASKSDEV
ncbi:hypothetical protein [Nesterenkonia aurantiaca]|uniref:Uncharacterized protein n=1 Tax=Nesterenkonia aurantiaca TaxID=1436010 RepID=A0A4R7FYC7_9MICC|nr:hypothetical protein [Nesterenkonia aurantiaca]TDS83811.1 hypothetical protein EV640_109101 [Nesterenkonia aurantiaca]